MAGAWDWGHPTPKTGLGDLRSDLLSDKGLESASLEELPLNMRPSLVIMAWSYQVPPWKQGRSHGCTVFGFRLAGVCQTGITASKAF